MRFLNGTGGWRANTMRLCYVIKSRPCKGVSILFPKSKDIYRNLNINTGQVLPFLREESMRLTVIHLCAMTKDRRVKRLGTFQIRACIESLNSDFGCPQGRPYELCSGNGKSVNSSYFWWVFSAW